MRVIQARGWENFVYVAHLLGEAGVPGEPLGANAIAITDDAEVPDDVAAELASVSDFAAAGGDQGAGSAPQLTRDHQPLGPAALSPVPLPPKTGPGATRKAWARYALQQKPPVNVTDAMSRDDIIRAVEAHPDDR
jgi:hypothetical protein